MNDQLLDQVTDSFDEMVRSSQEGLESPDFRAVLSRIPALFGTSEKATYLALRALGLPSVDACGVLRIKHHTILTWCKNDEFFAEIENNRIIELQRHLGPDLARISFLKNAVLLYAQDGKLIKRLLEVGLDGLSDREYTYLTKVRSQYTPAQILDLEKAVNPERHQEKITVQLTWGDAAQIIEATEATYKELGEPNLLEGEVAGTGS